MLRLLLTDTGTTPTITETMTVTDGRRRPRRIRHPAGRALPRLEITQA